MHDRPPIQLMNFNSLCKLIRNNSKSLSYFLPFSLLNIGISEQKLTHEERFNMIEIAFYYLIIYYGEIMNNENILPNNKYRNMTNVRLFSNNIIIESCNTMISILSTLQSHNKPLNLNRIGTNPLEHTFGTIRMRSKYRHTYERMIRSMGKIELYKKTLKDLKNQAKSLEEELIMDKQLITKVLHQVQYFQ